MDCQKPVVLPPEILLPNASVDLEKWAVIACDQYTSNEAYWKRVEAFVGDSPSTLNLIFPEYYLGKVDEAKKIQQIRSAMRAYDEENVFTTHRGMILVERRIGHATRYGLMAAIDLEAYDYTRTSTSWIRATEGTVAERIPPRMKIREGAPLELPHILVLVDDTEKLLIEPLVAIRDTLPVVYDFDLMMGSGHIRGYSLADGEIERRILAAVDRLRSDETLTKKYGPLNERNRILFAIGDGNHSLATAKEIWEKNKKAWGPDHPARYAMVELENLHDAAQEFEPIHRIVSGLSGSLKNALTDEFGGTVTFEPFANRETLFAAVDATKDGVQSFGLIEDGEFVKVTFAEPRSALCVGSVQQFLDQLRKAGFFKEVDYLHGTEELSALSDVKGNAGIYLPPVQKNGFFEGIIKDGALPRKTFSMGEAQEKRFYIEARRIL